MALLKGVPFGARKLTVIKSQRTLEIGFKMVYAVSYNGKGPDVERYTFLHFQHVDNNLAFSYTEAR